MRGSPMDFCDYAWWPPLYFPHNMAKKITEYRDTAGLRINTAILQNVFQEHHQQHGQPQRQDK